MRQVITQAEIPLSGELKIAKGGIVTPSARDLANDRGVKIVEVPADQLDTTASPDKTVALGSDHGGFPLKETLKPIFEELGFAIVDVGTHDEKPVDYPDIARAKSPNSSPAAKPRAASSSTAPASAPPSSPTNFQASARPCVMIKLRREIVGNIMILMYLRLAGACLTASQAEDVLRVWLTTPFAGGRHAARVQKIAEIEKAAKNWTPRS